MTARFIRLLLNACISKTNRHMRVCIGVQQCDRILSQMQLSVVIYCLQTCQTTKLNA